MIELGTKPYTASSSNLPPAVRKLSAKKRRQWAAIWDSIYKKTGDEGQAFAGAYAGVKATDGLEAILSDKAFWADFRKKMRKVMVPIFLTTMTAGTQAGARIKPKAKATLRVIPAGSPEAEEIANAADAYVRDYSSKFLDQLEESTRNQLRAAILASRENGTGVESVIETAQKLFGPDRAQRIAVTEVTNLFGAGAIASYKAAELDEWEWSTVNDPFVCFPAGQLVSTPYGERPIETLSIGDLVCTPNGDKSILKVFRSPHNNQLIELKATNGRSLVATSNHPIRSENDWIALEDLEPGNGLKSIDNKPLKVLSLHDVLFPNSENFPPKTPITVYNLEVEDAHCYYVSGILVHNCDECADKDGERFSVDEDFEAEHPGCRCFPRAVTSASKSLTYWIEGWKYNENHDPDTGQFTFGDGGGSVSTASHYSSRASNQDLAKTLKERTGIDTRFDDTVRPVVQAEISSVIDDLYQKYPDAGVTMIGFRNGEGDASLLNDAAVAVMRTSSTNEGYKSAIIFNTNKIDNMGGRAKFAQAYKEDEQYGFHPKTSVDPFEAMVIHEYGHAVGNTPKGMTLKMENARQYAKLSKYASFSQDEAFAEAFLVAQVGTNSAQTDMPSVKAIKALDGKNLGTFGGGQKYNENHDPETGQFSSG